MVSSIYKKTFSVLMKRPFRLWGISLLAEFLCPVSYTHLDVYKRQFQPSFHKRAKRRFILCIGL